MRIRTFLLAVALLLCGLAVTSSADARLMGRVAGGEHWQAPRPTLEQLAYRYWGARLRAACPNGSLKFTVSPKPPYAWQGDVDGSTGGSWGDCHPWLKSGERRPALCAVAIHEGGHEVGLVDRPNMGGIMDNTRMIIGQLVRIRVGHHWIHRQAWTGIPAICQPR